MLAPITLHAVIRCRFRRCGKSPASASALSAAPPLLGSAASPASFEPPASSAQIGSAPGSAVVSTAGTGAAGGLAGGGFVTAELEHAHRTITRLRQVDMRVPPREPTRHGF